MNWVYDFSVWALKYWNHFSISISQYLLLIGQRICDTLAVFVGILGSLIGLENYVAEKK